MRALPGLPGPLTAVPALLLLSCCLFAVPAHAADDSNAGQLGMSPTVTPQQLNSALNTLAQGSNDTQLQQLLSQFQSQLSSGNNTGAAATLSQLQGLSANGQGLDSATLNALLQSLTVGNSGASVNGNTLASLLTASTGSSSESPQKLSADMQSLAGLMKYANSTLASELLQNSSLLSQGAISGAIPGGGHIALPGASGLSGLSIPSVGTPSLSIGTPSAAIPSVPLAAFAIPLVAAAAIVALFFSRGRLVRLVGSQRLPGMALLGRSRDDRELEAQPLPSDPRGRIEFYFGRATRLMARRGFPKLESETHREFSSKCEGTAERPHVKTISSLYEKAKFSGQTVESPDADLAASELQAMGTESP